MLTRMLSVDPPLLQTLNEATTDPLVDPVTKVELPAAEGVADPRITYDAIYIPPNMRICGSGSVTTEAHWTPVPVVCRN